MTPIDQLPTANTGMPMSASMTPTQPAGQCPACGCACPVDAQQCPSCGVSMAPDATNTGDPAQAEAESFAEVMEGYWAKDTAENLIGHLGKKESEFYEAINRRGLARIWRLAFAQHYGLDPDFIANWETQQVGFDGEDGELLRFRINEVRSYTEQTMTMALNQRPSFEAVARNADYDALAQVEAADVSINSLYEDRYGEKKERMAVLRMLLFGKSFSWPQWDPHGGKTIDVPVTVDVQAPDGSIHKTPVPGKDGEPLTRKQQTGDVFVRVLSPWDVVHEVRLSESEEHLWREVRERRSKWEVAAENPDKADRIAQLSASSETNLTSVIGFDLMLVNEDDVIVKHFYHAKTKALPQGRYVCFVGDVVIYDGPLPYEKIMLRAHLYAEYIGTGFGYSKMWDLLSINQMIDQLNSDAATSYSTLGRQVIVAPDGVDWDTEALANGFRVLTYPPTANKPEAINFAMPAQGFQGYLQYLHGRMGDLSALGSTSRGDPDSNIKSGQMAALMHSIALEAQSDLQLTVDMDIREGVANDLLDIARDFAEYPLLFEMAGADERSHIASFTRDKLQGIHRVKIKTANPLMRTQAGRLQIAEMLMKIPGAVQVPSQLIELLVSGQWKAVYKASRNQMMRIAWENEQLSAGTRMEQVPDPTFDPSTAPPIMDPATGQMVPAQPPMVWQTPDVPVLAIDNPGDHIAEHAGSITPEDIASQWLPEDPKNPGAPRQTDPKSAYFAKIQHILWHLREARVMDPLLASLMKFPPPPPPPGLPAQLPDGGDHGDGGKGGEAPDVGGATDAQPRSLGVPLPKPSTSPMQEQQGAQ